MTVRVLNSATAALGSLNAALVAHAANTANPHAVTKAQVGLGSADNTADSAKPVSSAQQVAFDADRARLTSVESGRLDGDALGVGYDVILLTGQSNMTGQGTTIDLTNFEVTDPRIKQFPATGANVGKVITANDPLLHMDTGNVGHAMAFARWYARWVAPNRIVLLVPAARSSSGFTTTSAVSPPAGFYNVAGTNMGSWDPANGSGGLSLYDNAITMANAAMALPVPIGGSNRLAAIMWHQGEADGGLTQAQYAAKLDALIDGFRAGIMGASATTPFILGQLLPENIAGNPQRAITNLAHIDTPRRKIRTGLYYGALGGGMPDNVHYAASGQRLLGAAAPEAFLIARANVLAVAPVAPTAVTLAQASTSVVVSWTRPVGRATDYTVEYNAAGAGWVTLTRAQSIDKSATITGLTLGATLSVRVSTVNEVGTSGPSTAASMTLATLPGQVTGLAAGTATGATMPLTWTATATATSYLIEYKAAASGTWLTGSTVTTNAGTVSGLTDSTSYNFRVSAINAAGTGTVSATTTASTIAPTTLLAAVGVAAYRAYGLRKLNSSATSAIRVRRSSDSTEQDIGFTGSQLDTAALLTFAGVGSAFVKTLYDQSGNTRDLTQTVAGNQPRIVNAGVLDTDNTKPCMVFGGTPYFEDTGGGIFAAGASSTLAVAKSSSGTLQCLWGEGKVSATGRTVVYASSAGLLTIAVCNDANVNVANGGGAMANAALAQGSAVDSGTNESTWVNAAAGTNTAYTRTGVTTVDKFTVGKAYLSAATPGSGWLGNISELVIFAASLTTGQRQAGEANQKSFFATP